MKFNLWNMICTMLTVFSIALAFYFHSANQKEREPTFLSTKALQIYESHSNLQSSNYKMIQITPNGEKPLTGKVYVQELAFWNKGRKSIENDDILETLAFEFPTGYEVIDAFISEATRPKIVAPEVEFNANKVSFSFAILEKDDGFKIQMIIAGSGFVNPILNGTIKEVSNFNRKEDLTKDNIYYFIASVVLFLLAFCAVSYLIIYIFYEPIKKLGSKIKDKKITRYLEKCIGGGSIFQ